MVGAALSESTPAAMKVSPLVVASVGTLMLVTSAVDRQPMFVWNATASAPLGLYRIVAGKPQRGSLALIRLPEPFRTLAHIRGYLPDSVPVLKPIAALHGDMLCRRGSVVTVNRGFVAIARQVDYAGRPLPRWRGCRRLGVTDVAVASSHPHSFDSRYFGPLDRSHIVGFAIPVWTSTKPSSAPSLAMTP